MDESSSQLPVKGKICELVSLEAHEFYGGIFCVCFWWLERLGNAQWGIWDRNPHTFHVMSDCPVVQVPFESGNCYHIATWLQLVSPTHCIAGELEAFNRGARYRVATTLVKWRSQRSQCYRLSLPMTTWNWISCLLDTNKPPASIRLGDRIFRNQWQLLTEEIWDFQ